MEPRLGGKAAVSELLAALRGSDMQARLRAGRVLKRITDPQAVMLLLPALEDEQTQVRSVAAAALGTIGAHHGEREHEAVIGHAVPPLLHALHDPQIPVRMAAARALGQIGDPRAFSPLVDALHDASPHVRARVAAALGEIALRLGSGGAWALAALLGALKDGDSEVRMHAAEALGRIGAAQEKSALRAQPVPGLLEAFRDDSVQVRSAAARALGWIVPDAVPGLIAALRDEEMQVRSAAAWVLEQIGEQYGQAAARAVPPLLAALDDPDEGVRWYAVGALGVLRDPRAVPRLVRLLDDEDQPYRGPYDERRICDVAAEALEKIGTPEASAAVRIWRVAQGKNGL